VTTIRLFLEGAVGIGIFIATPLKGNTPSIAAVQFISAGHFTFKIRNEVKINPIKSHSSTYHS